MENLIEKVNGTWREYLRKLLWFLSIARNALVVLLCALTAFLSPDATFRLVDSVDEASDSFGISLPPFSVSHPPSDAPGAPSVTYGFLDMLANIGGLIVVLPVVSILQHMAIAKAFGNSAQKKLFSLVALCVCRRSAGSKPVDATQELLSLGAGNLLGSFLSGMPITGSFSRSAVNSASGVRSPGAGVFASSVVVLAITCFMPAFAFIPKASLAAVIICAMIFGVDVAKAKSIWRTNSK